MPNSSLNDFFAWYHPRAKRDYRDPEGQVLACALIAAAFVRLTGGQAYRVYGLRLPGSGSGAALLPRTRAGIRWGGHVVCIKDGFAYDVLRPGPVEQRDYLRQAFRNGQELLMAPVGSHLADDFYLRAMAADTGSSI